MDDGQRGLELRVDQLRRKADPARLGFQTTETLPAPERMVGQDRAQEAIEFALGMPDGRYNLYVAGEPGTGRRIAVMSAVERIARERPPTQDWCYVHNFEQPDEPRVVAVPPGLARTFAHDVDDFVRGCRVALRRAFGSEVYERQRTDLLADIEARRVALIDEIQAQALALGFLIRMTETGLAVLPARLGTAPATTPLAGGEHGGDPEPMAPEDLAALSEEERARLREHRSRMDALLTRVFPQLHVLDEDERTRVRTLDHEVAERTLVSLTDDITQRYAVSADALDFLRHLTADIVAHAEMLREGDELLDSTAESDQEANGTDGVPFPSGDMGESPRRPDIAALLRRYSVNVLVSRKPDEAAPIVEELNPARGNLLGRIEYGMRNGLPFTDHTMIKAGSLHRANGGFLILQAFDLVSAPHSWEGLKRMLRFGAIAMETSGETSGTPASATLRPEPIPADVRVILIGDAATYRALQELDPEFRLLFKVRAEFDDEMPRTPETELAYARYAGNVARTTGNVPLASEAVALIIEEGSRWAEDQERLSALFGDLRDLTLETCFWAKRDGAPVATAAHVARAVVSRERRKSLYADKLDDLVNVGTRMIATDGQVLGQINGLAVMHASDFSFGRTERITARTSPGLAGAVSIERESAMSGPIHAKGVLILQGFLAGRFAQETPLSVSATLCFEQNYEDVEGDSASAAELFALLSALANAPVRQSLAVTGAVNQHGEVQAIGGATLKVEAFFKTCAARGLTGQQGVIIPAANVRHLMLRQDVLDAVQAGQFHLYAINTIDEGIELLTGIPAGRPGTDGRYLEGTINARVSQTLRAYSERVRTFAASPAYAIRPIGN